MLLTIRVPSQTHKAGRRTFTLFSCPIDSSYISSPFFRWVVARSLKANQNSVEFKAFSIGYKFAASQSLGKTHSYHTLFQTPTIPIRLLQPVRKVLVVWIDECHTCPWNFLLIRIGNDYVPRYGVNAPNFIPINNLPMFRIRLSGSTYSKTLSFASPENE